METPWRRWPGTVCPPKAIPASPGTSLTIRDIDILITVCDSADGETCPVYLGSAVRGHWGLPDPAHVTGSPEVIEAAFEATYAALEKRIQQLLALPVETMSRAGARRRR